MKFLGLDVIAVLLTASLLSCSSALAAEAPASPVPAHVINNQATRIIGLAVENLDGEKLGRIRNLIIAVPSGEVKYVIVASGGILGVEARLKVVPAEAISLATAKKRTASLDISLRQWKAAPQFKPKAMVQLAESNRMAQVATFYTLSATRPRSQGNQPSAVQKFKQMLRKEFPAKSELRLVTEITGRRVVAANQELIGDVYDLLLDLEGGKPTFAIVSALRQTRKDYTFAAPLSSVKMVSETQFVLNTSLAALEQARGFNELVWASPEPGFTYRYNVLAADNTGWNARDRKAASLTPPKQSENERDFQITRTLRQSLMRDDGLTLTAKNVKIITINGRVTLRGPVKHAGEKAAIEKKAEEIAGNGKVDNQLVVEQSP
jgi:hyperosmotically inducible protein